MKIASSELLDFAQCLADIARPISRGWFRRELEIHIKADGSLVTDADREVEIELRRLIQARYPHHGILGEEMGLLPAQSDFVWVLDPIDGTKSFVTGMPIFGTLIGLLHFDVPCLGVIDIPELDERWMATGQSATFNGSLCRTRTDRCLATATMYSSVSNNVDQATRASIERVGSAAAIRCSGGDCYAYGLLASGTVDVVVEAGLEPYDYLALAPVIECAGGVISDWWGRPLRTSSGGRVVAAASGPLHTEVLNALHDLQAGPERASR